MRLDEFYRGELGVLALLEYVDGLPSHSRFAAAIANDDEAAEQLLALADDAPASSAPPLTDMTPEAQRLDAVIDRLGEVARAVIGAAGGKPPKLKPTPRPVNALQRVRERAAEARHEALVDYIAERRRAIAARNTEGG